MPAQLRQGPRVTAEDHPENRGVPQPLPAEDDGNFKTRPIGFARALAGMWIGGGVASLLTLMTVAYPLGAGDTVAALSMLPLAVTLFLIVSGWIAANLFLD